MARFQSTKVELLDGKHNGLRQCVDMMLDGQKTLEDIQTKVLETFKEHIAISTLSSYKQERWLKRKKRVEAIKDHAEAILQIMDDGRAITDITQALIFEKVQDAMDSGAELDPEFLLSEQRKLLQLQLKKQQLEQAKRALELKVQQLETQRAAERKKLEEAVGESKDPQLTVKRIREIYGIA